jgi:rubrerythrin
MTPPATYWLRRYLKDIELKESSDYQDVLTSAMKRQERVIDFFNSLAAMTPAEEVATIFRAIRNEESSRLRQLEEIYDDEILLEG